MKAKDFYKSGYKFAKKQEETQVRILTILSLLLPFFIIIILCVGFITSLNFFASKKEVVNRVYEDEDKKIQEQIDAATELQNSYKEAKIPYDDPNGKYSIIFLTPYVSGEIGVVINSEKEYDKSKSEADKIINAAREKVNIESVNYIKNY